MTDRELDALVAEKVMGEKYQEKCQCDFPGCGTCAEYKSYSTDISAAWEVVEKLRVKWDFVLKLCRGYCEACFQILYHDQFDSATIHRAEADTAPRAICLAALKAVGIEVKDAQTTR